MKSFTSALLLLVTSWTMPVTLGFTWVPFISDQLHNIAHGSRRHDYHPFSLRLTQLMMAKKAGGKKAVSAKGFGGGGGGFASAASQTSNKQQQKTRSLSQHAPGAGTKPLRNAANTFDKLRQDYGKDCTNDVYCRSPDNDVETFWFVGKVAVRPDTAATPDQAVISQKRLILEYCKSELRPQNFAGKYASTLELWLAPGDSEMDAVQNKVSLTKVDGSLSDLADDFNVKDVGFNPEIYVVRRRRCFAIFMFWKSSSSELQSMRNTIC